MNEVTCDVVADHVAMVRLRRPPNNFFDTELLSELAGVYEEVAATAWCRAIVLSSEGRHFCAGLDFATNERQDIAELYGHAIRLFAAPLPVVAAVGAERRSGGRLRTGPLRRLPDRLSQQPVQRQLRPSRFPSRVRHVGDAARAGWSAGGGGPPLHRPADRGRRGSGHGALRRPGCRGVPAGEGHHIRPYDCRLGPTGRPHPSPVRTLREGLVERLQLALAHECAEQERLRHTDDFAEGLRASAARRDPDFSGA